MPWTAAIGKLLVDGADPCTAILVSADVILTASHCLHQLAVPADPASLHFEPNFGAKPDLQATQGIALRAQGGAIHDGRLKGLEQVAADWALVAISPAVTKVLPIPLAPLTSADIRARLAGGARLFTAGYGYGSMKSLKQHSHCTIVEPMDAMPVYEQSVLVTTCIIRLGDSGGPVILLDKAGRPSLIGVFAAFGLNAKTGLSYAVNVASVAPYLKDGLISALPVDAALVTLADVAVFFPDPAELPVRPRPDGFGARRD